MPEISVEIGGREFKVACGAGEELHLRTAAGLLDGESKKVSAAAGQLPESRMLLMSGLMLADRMSAQVEQERYAEERIDTLETRLREAEDRAAKLRFELETIKETTPAPAPAPSHLAASDEGQEALVALERLAGDLEALAGELEAGANG